MKNNIILFVLLLVLPALVLAAPTRVRTINVQEQHNVTQITWTLTRPTTWHVFSLAHPTRIIVDIDHAQSSLDLKKIVFPKTHMMAIRNGYPKSGTLRMVLDVNEHVYYKIITKQQQMTQIQLNLISNEKKISKNTASNFLKPIVVVIDPGHGGKDPGAVGQHGTQEKNVVLAIAKMLAYLINQQPHMRAVLTRQGDYFVSLRQRLQIARKSKADLFIAIHADSYLNDKAAGASVYTLSHHGASSMTARWLAQRENHSELDGVDLNGLQDQSTILRSVLLDLAQTSTNRASLLCGTSLLDALNDVTKLHYAWIEQAPFMVLKSPDIPSILVETGFISNIKEENRLRDKQHQQKLAAALFEGIHTFQKKYLMKEA